MTAQLRKDCPVLHNRLHVGTYGNQCNKLLSLNMALEAKSYV